jgi:hypothetical protein
MIKRLAAKSPYGQVRYAIHPKTADKVVWPAAHATHADVMHALRGQLGWLGFDGDVSMTYP